MKTSTVWGVWNGVGGRRRGGRPGDVRIRRLAEALSASGIALAGVHCVPFGHGLAAGFPRLSHANFAWECWAAHCRCILGVVHPFLAFVEGKNGDENNTSGMNLVFIPLIESSRGASTYPTQNPQQSQHRGLQFFHLPGLTCKSCPPDNIRRELPLPRSPGSRHHHLDRHRHQPRHDETTESFNVRDIRTSKSTACSSKPLAT